VSDLVCSADQKRQALYNTRTKPNSSTAALDVETWWERKLMQESNLREANEGSDRDQGRWFEDQNGAWNGGVMMNEKGEIKLI